MSKIFSNKLGFVALALTAFLAGCGNGDGGITTSADLDDGKDIGRCSTRSASVSLGTAGNFAILAKSGISTVPN
ncbi:MAG: hypothetical protein Q8L64_02825, partial [bacterium]|nr:hypothetical protein [bacterium]